MNKTCKPFFKLAVSTFAASWLIPSLAQMSPVGLWQSMDDASGKPRAEIRIIEKSNILTGVIERNLLPNPTEAILICGLCSDDRKDKPLIGLEIIRHTKPSAEALVWDGGEILDPDKGKTFKLRLELLDNGKKLQVRGQIGPFFRNQTWIRIS
jgi:uncharacterized protein (DUF2147 family)